MTEITIVGGFLIAASGLAILKIKDRKTLNMLPASAGTDHLLLILKLIS